MTRHRPANAKSTKIMSYQEAKALDDLVLEKIGIQPPGHDTLPDILPQFPRGSVRLLSITPELAEAFLRTQRRNRIHYKANLKRLKDAISAGEWKVTGETLIFNDEGHLIDGQHRLLACIAANTVIKSYVVFGQIDDEAFMVLDTGMARSPGDLLHITGRVDSHHHAATLRWVYRLRTGGMRFETAKISRNTLLELAEKEGLSSEVLSMGRKVSRLIKPSLAAALYHEMRCKDAILAQYLFDGLASGTVIPDSMLHRLREALITNTLHRARLDETHIAAMIIKVWRALRRGQSIKMVRWYPERRGRPEPFPTID